MDPHSLFLLDPDPGGKIFQIKMEKGIHSPASNPCLNVYIFIFISSDSFK